jgi:hypothetical protein
MLKHLGFITVCLVISATGYARTTVENTKRLYMPQLTAEESVVASVSNKITKSLTAADSSQSVISKVIDSSLSYWWENSGIKNTSVGKAADSVEKKMQAEVNLGSTGAEKTEHKFSFKVLAAQALAKIEYIGWVKAALKYDAKSANAQAELLENLSNNKDLVISHSVGRAESKSQLSLRWNW